MRDPRTGPGLLIVEGRQYWFCPEGIWKLKVPPKPGLVVEVRIDPAGKILAITAAPESQLADRSAESSSSLHAARAAGVKILRKIAAKCGVPGLVRH